MPRNSHLATLRLRRSARSAKTLRSNLTDAERKLRYFLRAGRFEGCKFRRQVPLGRYVVDFLCEESRLIVEVDGGQHSDRAELDGARTQWLVAQGYSVLRFWNNDVLANIEGVLATLSPAATLSPTLSQGIGRKGRGRKAR